LRNALSLAIVDIDGFKSINDVHGHAEGDAILGRIADLLVRSVRLNVDGCYRLGGDEFAVLLPGADAAGALEMLHRICRSAREEPTSLDRVGASLSVGVVELQEKEGPEAFMKRADALMYEAKNKGKNRVEI
jgi:diguanylate cyclase (GGDEF)-like protein